MRLKLLLFVIARIEGTLEGYKRGSKLPPDALAPVLNLFLSLVM